MSILYAGGLWTVMLITAILSGYNWALNGPRWVYKALLGVALLVIAISQVFPAQHAFRVSVSEGLVWWFWALMVAIPVGLYVVWVRWLKRKVRQRDDP